MKPQKETTMKLLTIEIKERLLENGRKQEPVRGTHDEIDFWPVVKLFTPDAGCTWLLTEIDPEDTDIAFGLCDLGMGFPELGSVSLTELASVRGPSGFRSSATCTSRQIPCNIKTFARSTVLRSS
jgi:hypothetical protein